MKRIAITEERLHEIIKDVILEATRSMVTAIVTDNGEELGIWNDERLLKHVTATNKRHLRPCDYDVWASIGTDNYVTIQWKEVGKPRSFTRSEWMKPVGTSGRLYSSYANWDEMDWALECLGVKKVKKQCEKVDEFGDIKTFTKSYYDLSPIL